MKVIFYDRKNKREVANTDLMSISLSHVSCTADDDELVKSGRRYHPDTNQPFSKHDFEESKKSGYFLDNKIRDDFENWAEEFIVKYVIPVKETIATIGYKANKDDKIRNWDTYCNESDLVFLRLEE